MTNHQSNSRINLTLRRRKMNYEERKAFVANLDQIESKNKKNDFLHLFDHLDELMSSEELNFVRTFFHNPKHAYFSLLLINFQIMEIFSTEKNGEFTQSTFTSSSDAQPTQINATVSNMNKKNKRLNVIKKEVKNLFN